MSSTFKTRSRRVGSDTSSEADENAADFENGRARGLGAVPVHRGPLPEGGRRRCVPAAAGPEGARRQRARHRSRHPLRACRLRENLDLFFIEDDGPGLDGTPEEIASLFSIRRPMRSSKLLRLPQRGALGNGLRVVAGAVLASEGSLVVITRNQRIKLRPEANGSTTVVSVTAAKRPVGTRIEIGFGPALPNEGGSSLRLGAGGRRHRPRGQEL